MPMKDVVVIGGPNGAGKSTSANRILPHSLGIVNFLNADEIARGLSPFDPGQAAIAAGRLLITSIETLVRDSVSFAFETTCAGRSHLQRLRGCRASGYRIIFVFLWLPSAEHALARVAQRVANGGHGISDDVVVRRYVEGLHNMRHQFLPLADVALVYDNSTDGRTLIAEKDTSGSLVIHDHTRWQLIEDATR
jgi:predicted ABC-type ATPase